MRKKQGFILGSVEHLEMAKAFKRMFWDLQIKTTYIFIGNLGDPRYIKRSVKITRKRTKGDTHDFVVTVGPLNYREREYMRLCRKAKTRPRQWWAIPMPNRKKGIPWSGNQE